MADKNLSVMRSLCLGQIEEDVLFPYPQMKSTEKEAIKAIASSVETWLKGRDQDFRAWDREVVEEIRSFGFFGLIIPEDFGGLGFTATAYSRTLQELSKYDSSIALTVGAHSSIGMRGLLLFGSDAQKAQFLPKLSTGEMIAAFCLTEAGSGSDAASIKTKAVREGEDWVLTGEKLWITNGEIADFFTVFARTEGNEGQMTAFIVTRDMKGVSTGPHEDKMGIRASCTTTVILDQVRVPQAMVLGEVGKGFKVAMQILNSGRTGLGGGCVGAMKRLIALAAIQAKERKQFNQPIAEFGLVKEKVGCMMLQCFAAESTVNFVSGLIDQGYKDYAVEAAISKVFATEALWNVADEALQIAGGNGFMREFPYERILRDSRINRIFEGTNEVLRLFIALTAMHDVGKTLKELADSVQGVFKDPIKGFGVLSEYGLRKFSQATGVGGEKAKFTKVHPSLAREADLIEDLIRELAWSADRILRKHGKAIIGKQLATKRLADVMMQIFMLCATLSRVQALVEKQGLERTIQERAMLQALVASARRHNKAKLDQIDQNEDEMIKALADLAFEQEGYLWDNVLE
jgi:acyl-CoA dehydrogenase family member 9